jgi:MSHA biogenesis protein MshP
MKGLRGFAILSAIFILVVLAALGAFMLSVSSSQQIGSALDVQGVRAYQAARAGIEWGLYRQLQSSSCAATSSFTLGGSTFTGVVVTVTCNASTPSVTGEPVVYTLQSTACNQPLSGWSATSAACPNTSSPGSFYIERRLSVTF